MSSKYIYELKCIAICIVLILANSINAQRDALSESSELRLTSE